MRFWLALTFLSHAAYAAACWQSPVGLALAAAPLPIAWWFVHRKGVRYKPHQWPWVSLATAVPQGFGLVATYFTDIPALNLLFLVLLPVPPAIFAWLATESLTAPPAAELGDTPYQLQFRVRVRQKPFWHSDSVLLTEDELRIEVRSGEGRMAIQPTLKSLSLNDLTAIGVRAAVEGEAPWITLTDGRGLSVPAGEVVVLRTRSEEQVLPVEHARSFAEVIRTRTRGRLQTLAEQPVAAQRDGHVPEVLPAPEPTGPHVAATRGPDEPLPGGPGLAVRWIVGGTLALTGVAGVPLAALLMAKAPWPYLAWVGITLVVWVLNRNTPRVWGRVATLPVPLTLLWLGVERQWLLALALVLCPILGRLAGAMFRPGKDLAASSVEVVFPVRSGAHLRLQRDRLVLKLNQAGEGGIFPNAVWLRDIDFVQAGALAGAEPVWWPLPGGVGNRIVNAPVLRVVARAQQWLLPTDAARLVVDLALARAVVAPEPAVLDVGNWGEQRAWAVQQTTRSTRGGGYRTGGIGWRLFAAAITGTFGWMFVAIGLPIGAAIGLVLSVGLLADWLRVRKRMIVAEHNVLPPGSPDWGETRADHAPVPGWQPWTTS